MTVPPLHPVDVGLDCPGRRWWAFDLAPRVVALGGEVGQVKGQPAGTEAPQQDTKPEPSG